MPVYWMSFDCQAQLDRCRQDQAAAVVGVLADQVDAPWRPDSHGVEVAYENGFDGKGGGACVGIAYGTVTSGAAREGAT